MTGNVGVNPPARLIPDLTPYPPTLYLVVHHPDVQLTADEWLELAEYEKVSSDALCSPGVLGFMIRSDAKAVVPLSANSIVPPHVAAAQVHTGRNS